MLRDEIKQQRKKAMEGMTSWQKIKYLWYYNWKIMLIFCAVLIALFSLIRTIQENKKESYLSVTLVNSSTYDSSASDLMSAFAQSRQVDERQTPARVDTSLTISANAIDDYSVANSMKLQAMMGTGDCDILIADSWLIDTFGAGNSLCDLEQNLPQDLYNKVSASIYYYTNESGQKQPLGFYADQISKVKQFYGKDIAPIVSINLSAKNPEEAIDFIRYLFEE